MKAKLRRITTVPLSLKVLLKGQYRFMSEHFEVIGVSSPDQESRYEQSKVWNAILSEYKKLVREKEYHV